MGEPIKVFFKKKGHTQLKQSTIHLCSVSLFHFLTFVFIIKWEGLFFFLDEKSSFFLLFSGDIHEGRECGVHDVIERSVGFFKCHLLGISNGCKSDQFITVFFFWDQSRNLWVHIYNHHAKTNTICRQT